jgi:hypothetical protein
MDQKYHRLMTSAALGFAEGAKDLFFPRAFSRK